MNTNGISEIIKKKCEESLLFFTRYMFKENTGNKFEVAPFHITLAETLEAVNRGEIKRLIINIPPRYGKTEIAVKMYIAWSLAKNPSSKFIHLSYSDALALDNSSLTRDYVQSESFQEIWKLPLKKDTQGQKKWYTEQGGGVYATSSGGAITGFGAGTGGAIIIDDPLKPDDSGSDIKRNFINNRYNTTIRSRVNDRDVPIIIIMQRLHEDDITGFLLDGGSGEEWTHLKLSALNEDNEPLWPSKHSFEELEAIRQASRYTFSGQYMQEPAPQEGGEWRKDWFNIIEPAHLPADINWEMYIDGAYTENTKNDPTGIQISGSVDGNLYILKSIDKYLEMPELKNFISSFIAGVGVDVTQILIEPKASGKSLAQLLHRETRLNISELNTNFVKYSKIERARASSPFIEGGRVYLVKDNWNEAFLQQVSTFPNAKHDEHIDITSYAIERNLIKPAFYVV
jgi:predicted phage terminase large subunit-like protein